MEVLVRIYQTRSLLFNFLGSSQNTQLPECFASRMIAEKLEVKIVGREVVKPSRPTPPHLRRFNLSLVDQMAEHSLVPFLYFYSANGNTFMSFAEKCRHLKSSLSRTLSLFYPIAGRIRDSCSIDCCDNGAEFVEAELNCPMTHFSGSPDPDLLSLLVPVNIDPTHLVAINMKIEFLCLIQTTLLESGEVSICVCLSHKICDGVTYMRFIQTWATIATELDYSVGRVESPDLSLASLLPPNPDLESPNYSIEVSGGKSYKPVTRKLFFSASKLEELKRRASSTAVEKPTRVEAVMGLLSKCAVAAASTAANSSQHSAVWMIPANLRERLSPLVPKNTVGNLLGLVVVPTPIANDLSISDQVIALRRAKDVFYKSFESIGTTKDIKPLMWFQAGNEILSRVDMDHIYTITSICGLPNYFDFGWGRPKVVIPIMFIRNVVIVMDGEDLRGVQAYVTLKEQDMNFFEHDQHLLSFASISPPLSLNYVYDGKSGPKPKL